jgi:dynein heavy chain
MESSPASLMTYFAQQCKDHLHLVLAYSPLGSSLRDSVRYFPSLINCCTIDWFEVISVFLERRELFLNKKAPDFFT